MDTVTFLIKEIPLEIWDKFKSKIPRNTSLNEALIMIISDIANEK